MLTEAVGGPVSESGAADGVGWRAVNNYLRADTALLRKSWSLEERTHVPGHARPSWEAVRHRAAPQEGLFP